MPTVAFTQTKEAIRYSTLEHRKRCKKIVEESTFSRDILSPFKDGFVQVEEMKEISKDKKSK